jgi:hypothetical protein
MPGVLTLAESAVLAMAIRPTFTPWPYDHYDVLEQPVRGVIAYLNEWAIGQPPNMPLQVPSHPRLWTLWRLEDWLRGAAAGQRHNLRVRDSPFYGPRI